jgi:hypothetical protein
MIVSATNKTCTICNTNDSFIISNTCVNCTQILNTIGLNANNTACQCTPAYLWLWNSTTLTGSCYCNTTYSITQNGNCVNCKTLLYATGAISSNICVCLANFLWNSTSLTCYCPGGFTLNAGNNTCTCNTVDSVYISGYCINCTQISNTNGPNTNNTACQCTSPLQWSWNSSTLTGSCICNTTFEITSNGNCINCQNLSYATGVTTNNTCVCLPNFVWNSTSLAC